MTAIWFATPDIADMNRQMENTACSNLGIRITEVGDNWVKGTMPADERTFQPVGLVHGGANVLFAETLGSMAANLVLDNSKEYAVGQKLMPTTCGACAVVNSAASRPLFTVAAVPRCGKSASLMAKAN